MTQGTTALGVVTGKPISIGGSLGRREATSRGVYNVLSEAMAEIFPDRASRDLTVAIQGFGNVGANLAKILHQEGFRLVALSDVRGAVFRGDGIDVEGALRHAAETGSVAGPHGCESITNEELLTIPCDILVPAALGGQITGNNAGRVKAKV